MTILLYILLLAFFAIETPLITLMYYLYNHSTPDPIVSKMRQVIFIIAFAKALFIFSQIVLVFDSIIKVQQANSFVIWTYSLGALILACVDWWSLFQVRRLVK